MHAIHYRHADVDGHRLFYREAGAAGVPAVVLLHGFPASSFMFRNLIPRLADRYHVIAPDYLGFGLSDTPAVAEFGYTFDALAGLTAGLLRRVGITRYAMYVHDYGAPVGWRLALNDPGAVTAIITQNGNGYEAGFAEEFWKPVRKYWQDHNPGTEAAVRQALTLDAIRWQHLHGVAHGRPRDAQVPDLRPDVPEPRDLAGRTQPGTAHAVPHGYAVTRAMAAASDPAPRRPVRRTP